MFIEKLDIKTDVKKVLEELEEIKTKTTWSANQISLRHRENSENIWSDGVGSLFNYDLNKSKSSEKDYQYWNLDENSYIRTQIELLAKLHNFSIGRVRIMKLLPRSGLSIHADNELRYHLVLDTNPHSYFCFNTNLYNVNLKPIGEFYHVPANDHWYKMDTRKLHWVYNGGKTERIHLVVCEI